MRIDKQEVEKSFQVGGVDCPVCATEVQKELSKLDGIISANIDIESSKISVKIKSYQTSIEDVEKTLSQLGLQIHKEGSRQTSIFYVEGMDCANEERVVREALKVIDGIDDIKFDLVNQRLIVVHRIAEGKIIQALRSIGFNAEIYHNKLHLKSAHQKKKTYQIFFIALSSLFVIAGMISEYLELPASITIALFAISVLSGGYKIFHKAFLSAKKLIIDINVLMSLAVFGALIIGKYSEAAVVMLLYAVSLQLESFSIDKAKSSINKLIALIPEYSTVKRGNDFIAIPTTEVRIGDLILIKPGEKIPVDGIVIDGSSVINQSPITGESKLIAKVRGDHCYAGTINQKGTLIIEATSTYKDSHFSKILVLLEEATTNSKSELQRVVDVFAKYYTPVVVFLAFVISLYSYFIDQQELYSSIYKGLILLVISCPCALVISTPVAILSSLARAAKFGALFKGGIFLENLHRVDAVAFDKTGTLTEGNLKIEKIIPLKDISEDDLIQIAYNLEIRSEHSIADAIVNYAKEKNFEAEVIEDFKVEVGAVSGIYKNRKYKIGQPKLFQKLLKDDQKQIVNNLEETGYTVIVLIEEDTPIGLICLIDSLRESIKKTVESLRKEGVKEFFILSGDNKSIVEKVASEVGIEKYFAELKPSDKVELIDDLRKNYPMIAMIGDGLNDAPALKKASIGIAMGKIGVDATIESSDITLIGDDIAKLPKLFRLSRKTVKTIKENISLSISIKFAFVILAFLGYASMWGAIFADMGTSLIVIFNSLRLLKTEI
jgi:Cd2+/Zn2+-exporting ATPase